MDELNCALYKWMERFRMGLDRKVEMLPAALPTAGSVLQPGSSVSRAITLGFGVASARSQQSFQNVEGS